METGIIRQPAYGFVLASYGNFVKMHHFATSLTSPKLQYWDYHLVTTTCHCQNYTTMRQTDGQPAS